MRTFRQKRENAMSNAVLWQKDGGLKQALAGEGGTWVSIRLLDPRVKHRTPYIPRLFASNTRNPRSYQVGTQHVRKSRSYHVVQDVKESAFVSLFRLRRQEIRSRTGVLSVGCPGPCPFWNVVIKHDPFIHGRRAEK